MAKKNVSQQIAEGYSTLAAMLGISVITEAGILGLAGEIDGYDVVLYPNDYRYPYHLTLVTGVSSMAEVNKDALKAIKKSNKMVQAARQNKGHLILTFKNAKANKLDDLSTAVKEALGEARRNYFNAACGSCGSTMETREYLIGADAYKILCPTCAGTIKRQLDASEQIEDTNKEFVLLGIVGALLGSLAGVASIIILSQLGYVAVISGIIMATCTLKLYEKFASKISIKGIIICIVIMLGMVWFGDAIDWAIRLYGEGGGREYGFSFFECFRYLHDFMQMGVIESSAYYGNLVLLYLFTIGGIVPTVINMNRKSKLKNRMIYIGKSSDNDAGKQGV